MCRQRHRPRPRRGRRDLGSVSAEFAVATPALVLVLVALLAAAVLGLTQVRASDAARAAAREAARGEDRESVVEEAKRRAGNRAEVAVDSNAGYTTVTVTVRVTGPVSAFARSPIRASAVARTENDP